MIKPTKKQLVIVLAILLFILSFTAGVFLTYIVTYSPEPLPVPPPNIYVTNNITVNIPPPFVLNDITNPPVNVNVSIDVLPGEESSETNAESDSSSSVGDVSQNVHITVEKETAISVEDTTNNFCSKKKKGHPLCK
jgi:hypothetical protein